MKEYETLKQFWDKQFETISISSIKDTWIVNEKIISILNTYINKESTILDYGTGQGWAIFEIALRKKFKKAIGIDTSANAIEANSKIATLSNFDNVYFLEGDQNKLSSFKDSFDFVWSVNTFDVLPNNVIEDIYEKIVDSMKDGATLFIGLNPDFTIDELTNLIKMERKGNYFFKDDVLRCNKKSIDEWTAFFSRKLKLVDHFKFALTTKEEKYPRVGFIFQK